MGKVVVLYAWVVLRTKTSRHPGKALRRVGEVSVSQAFAITAPTTTVIRVHSTASVPMGVAPGLSRWRQLAALMGDPCLGPRGTGGRGSLHKAVFL